METQKNQIDLTLENFWGHLQDHWLRYTALLVTGVLTGYAAWSYTGNWMYVAALIALSEGASLYWSARIETYGNKVQAGAAVVGSILSWASIAVTDIASVTIIAKHADITIFAAFAQVPEWAQRVVVYVLPVLAISHGLLGTLHYFFSEEARLMRDLAKIRRDKTRDIRQAKAEAEKNIAKAEADRYKTLSQERAPEIGRGLGEKSWNEFERTQRLPTVPTDGAPDDVARWLEGLAQEAPPYKENGGKRTDPIDPPSRR